MELKPNPKLLCYSQDEEAEIKGEQFGFKLFVCEQSDLMLIMVLAKLSPFILPGQKGRIIMECAKILRVWFFCFPSLHDF